MARCWLMKTEPDVYSIDDLRRDGHTLWEGVRNYQARNLLRDDFRRGDNVVIWHSQADPPGAVGLGTIVAEGTPDLAAQDPSSKYHDPKASVENPIWVVVDVAFVEKWAAPVTLPEIKEDPLFSGVMVAQRGSRLSVQPLSQAHYERLVTLGRARGQVTRK